MIQILKIEQKVKTGIDERSELRYVLVNVNTVYLFETLQDMAYFIVRYAKKGRPYKRDYDVFPGTFEEVKTVFKNVIDAKPLSDDERFVLNVNRTIGYPLLRLAELIPDIEYGKHIESVALNISRPKMTYEDLGGTM